MNGELMVEDRKVLSIDQDDALNRLQEGQNRALKLVPERDWAHRSADQISPFCLPVESLH